MHSRLDHINDWPALVKTASYSVSKIANLCGVSPRQLERYFHKRLQITPRRWVRELRMRLATEMLLAGESLKHVYFELGYKDGAHFTRDFKDYFGITPGLYVSRQPSLLLRYQKSRFDN